MEKNKEKCYEIAKQIYQLDKDVYECVGSSLGRTFTGDEATCVEEITRLLITRPQGHEIRSDIALIGNMARTIKNKEDHHRMMTQYNEILKKIAAIPDSFGSVDIINENLAALNTSNLRQKFSPDDHLIICIGRTHGSAGTDIGIAMAERGLWTDVCSSFFIMTYPKKSIFFFFFLYDINVEKYKLYFSQIIR